MTFDTKMENLQTDPPADISIATCDAVSTGGDGGQQQGWEYQSTVR